MNKIKNLADYEMQIAGNGLSEDDYKLGKYGYTDKALERISGSKVVNPKKYSFKMVDTCAAEFAAETPYFYSTCDAHCEARPFIKGEEGTNHCFGKRTYSHRSGVDYSSVHCKKL